MAVVGAGVEAGLGAVLERGSSPTEVAHHTLIGLPSQSRQFLGGRQQMQCASKENMDTNLLSLDPSASPGLSFGLRICRLLMADSIGH